MKLNVASTAALIRNDLLKDEDGEYEQFLDRHNFSGWSSGGCAVLAQALACYFEAHGKAAEVYDVGEHHVVAKVGRLYLDPGNFYGPVTHRKLTWGVVKKHMPPPMVTFMGGRIRRPKRPTEQLCKILLRRVKPTSKAGVRGRKLKRPTRKEIWDSIEEAIQLVEAELEEEAREEERKKRRRRRQRKK